MPDMNPFANNNMPSMSGGTPSYLKQDPSNGTYGGAMSNMVKALLDGNRQFQQRNNNAWQGMPRVGAQAGAAALPLGAGRPPGPPLSLAPPIPKAAPAPAAGPTPAAIDGPPATAPVPSEAVPSINSQFSGTAGPMAFAPSPGMTPAGNPVGNDGGSAPGMPNGLRGMDGARPWEGNPTVQALFSRIPGADFGG